MAKIKETKTTYSAEPITVVTTRGTTEIPRALRERYRVTAKSRLRWLDTGNGLLIVPLEKQIVSKEKARDKRQIATTRPENLEAIQILREWMREPDDWTSEQWDEFEQELRANRFRARDIEL
jgi:bifunctional DNA-binding transcriptional regulator/antitoxin component of YhaV-PrlF toxin-antitoxin module